MVVQTRVRDDANALELLESEDLELRELFTELRQRRGGSGEDRADYGDIAKEIVRQVTIREAALIDVAEVASDDPRLRGLASTIKRGRNTSRHHIDRVEKMSSGVRDINLRTGQDFDTEMEELIQVIGTEIEWDLGEAIPELRAFFEDSHREDELKSARQLRKHARPIWIRMVLAGVNARR